MTHEHLFIIRGDYHVYLLNRDKLHTQLNHVINFLAITNLIFLNIFINNEIILVNAEKTELFRQAYIMS